MNYTYTACPQYYSFNLLYILHCNTRTLLCFKLQSTQTQHKLTIYRTKVQCFKPHLINSYILVMTARSAIYAEDFDCIRYSTPHLTSSRQPCKPAINWPVRQGSAPALPRPVACQSSEVSLHRTPPLT